MIQLPGVLAAAGEVQVVCLEHGWRFCFIGEVTVQRWGEPRLTQDVDLTLLTGFGREEKELTSLDHEFPAADWDVPIFFAEGTGGSTTAWQQLPGGSPGAFREIVNTVGGAPPYASMDVHHPRHGSHGDDSHGVGAREGAPSLSLGCAAPSPAAPGLVRDASLAYDARVECRP